MCGEGCGARAAAALQHVNLLLVLFAGACLATGARLRWDPSLYVPVRELLPVEYRVAAAAVPAAGAALLALAHLALAAAAPAAPAPEPRTPRQLDKAAPTRPRRRLLYTYAGLMMLAVALELGVLGWIVGRAAEFSRSPQAAELEQMMATREHLQPLLQHLAQWHPIPERLHHLIAEVEEDLPWNGYVAAAALAALLLLQLAAAALALLAANCAPRARRAAALSASRVSLVNSLRNSAPMQHCKLVIVWLSLDRSSSSSSSSSSRGSVKRGDSAERAPLRAKYRNGRIVPV